MEKKDEVLKVSEKMVMSDVPTPLVGRCFAFGFTLVCAIKRGDEQTARRYAEAGIGQLYRCSGEEVSELLAAFNGCSGFLEITPDVFNRLVGKANTASGFNQMMDI